MNDRALKARRVIAGGGQYWCAVIGVILATAVLANWQFVNSCDRSTVLAMNDVDSILQGYRDTPNLLADGLRWWHYTLSPWFVFSAYWAVVAKVVWLNTKRITSWMGANGSA